MNIIERCILMFTFGWVLGKMLCELGVIDKIINIFKKKDKK